VGILGHIDYLAGMVVFFSVFVLLITKRMPSVEGFEHFLASLNSKGGNIAILSLFTYMSLVQTVRWFYHILGMIHANQLTEGNSFATLGAQFLTTTAFGMFAGALISTLTGLKTDIRRSDLNGNGGGGDKAP
jgi:hypothetical protein